MAERYWDIDLLRGVAIVGMVIFHLLWNLDYLGMSDIDPSSTFMYVFAHAIGTSFLLLVGLSLSISHSRARASENSHIVRKYLLRGMTIFGLGMAISLITFIFLERWVVFGVLHCIGLSIILAIPFLGRGYLNILMGAGIVIIGVLMSGVSIGSPWLVWLGLEYPGFMSLDHYPLIPWFGVVLIGLGLGNVLYPKHVGRISMPRFGRMPVKGVCLLGRHSLLIYLVHQPLLLGVLFLALMAT